MSPAADLDALFAALADPARRAVVDLLRKAPRRSSEIAEAVALDRPTASRHLKVLREAGVVEEESDGADARVRLYRLRPERFVDFRRWLDDVESFWDDQLRAFKNHVEKKRAKRRA
jgi:DNA-binding transcriptional ArsR family regulator